MPKNIRIIIADDNQAICSNLKDILTEKGFSVETAQNGYELLVKLKQKIPHLIILDLIMPEKGGIDIFSTIKSISPHIKIIIYTGFKKYEQTIYAYAADKFLVKGESPEKLLQAINELTKNLPLQKNNHRKKSK